MSDALPGTASAATAIARVSYTHDAMVDLLIANPQITNNALAEAFGYTPAWVSRIKNSDAFQLRLAARKTDLVDPELTLSIEEKLAHVAHRGLDILAEKLEGPASMIPMDTALKAVEIRRPRRWADECAKQLRRGVAGASDFRVRLGRGLHTGGCLGHAGGRFSQFHPRRRLKIRPSRLLLSLSPNCFFGKGIPPCPVL